MSQTDTLFEWFNGRVAVSYAVAPASHPAETLRQLGAPDSLAAVFLKLTDCEVVYKRCQDGLVPDLERREKSRKRSTGQFYTPEALALRLAGLAEPIGIGEEILDPACGDGSFLMAVAASLAAESKSGSSDGGLLAGLYGCDIDLPALFVCLTRLICAFPASGWPNLELRDFLLEPPTRRFALIVGNPPYRVNLAPEFKNRLAELYDTGEGEKDLYTFFLEGSLRRLKPSGQLIMLTSHTYLVNHQCEKIRRLIFGRYRVEALLMLPARFFSAAPGVLPVVIVVKNCAPHEADQLKVCADYSESAGWQREYRARAATFESCSGLRQAIVPEILRKAFSEMEQCGTPLGQLCKVGVGIQESLKRDGPVSRHVGDQSLTAAHRPVLRGREVSAFRINWEGKYIDYGPHLAYAGNEEIFAGPKILYQNIRNEKLKQRLVAAFDAGGFFPKNSLSYIISESPAYSSMFVVGLLNSSLVNAWFSGRFHSFHVTVTQIRQIPMPKAAATAVKEVERLSESLMSAAPDGQEFVSLLSRLNQAVCMCYALSGDHQRLLLQCDNFLEQAAGL